jgi:hypothetical protein
VAFDHYAKRFCTAIFVDSNAYRYSTNTHTAFIRFSVAYQIIFLRNFVNYTAKLDCKVYSLILNVLLTKINCLKPCFLSFRIKKTKHCCWTHFLYRDVRSILPHCTSGVRNRISRQSQSRGHHYVVHGKEPDSQPVKN